jgi:hypothetical protein
VKWLAVVFLGLRLGIHDTPTVPTPPPTFDPQSYVTSCQGLVDAYAQYQQLEDQVRTLTHP